MREVRERVKEIIKKIEETWRDELPLHHPAYCLQIIIDKVNEIVVWINKKEKGEVKQK